MAEFSSVDASVSGFRLIGKRPAAALIWVFFWLIVEYVPVAAMLAFAAPMLGEILTTIQAAQEGVDQPTVVMERAASIQSGLSLIGLPWFVWVLIGQAMLTAAVFRASLRPEQGGFGFLRLGKDELNLILLTLLQIVFYVVFVLALCAAVGAAVWAASAYIVSPWSGYLQLLAILIGIAIAVLVPVRLSLAAPMTFAEGEVRFFQSWGLTAGRFWPLLGMFVVILILLIAVQAVMMLISAPFVLGGLAPVITAVEAMQAGDIDVTGFMAALGPLMVLGVVFDVIGAVLLSAVFHTPYAVAYRSLMGGAEASE